MDTLKDNKVYGPRHHVNPQKDESRMAFEQRERSPVSGSFTDLLIWALSLWTKGTLPTHVPLCNKLVKKSLCAWGLRSIKWIAWLDWNEVDENSKRMFVDKVRGSGCGTGSMIGKHLVYQNGFADECLRRYKWTFPFHTLLILEVVITVSLFQHAQSCPGILQLHIWFSQLSLWRKIQ